MMFLVILFFMMCKGYAIEFLIVFFSVLLHELGHILSIILSGGSVYFIRLLPVGLNAQVNDAKCSKGLKIINYISGPCVNFLLFALFLGLNSYCLKGLDNMRFFILTNFYLSAFNMLPVLPLDGGKILREILAGYIGLFSADKFLKRITFASVLGFIVLGCIQFFYSHYNFSMLIIGIYLFFCLRIGKREAALMNIKDNIYRKSRLLRKGFYPARDIVVIQWMRMGEVLKFMDFDRFHIIYVLDNDLKVMKLYTEQEIMNVMLSHNSDITFEEYMRIEKDS